MVHLMRQTRDEGHRDLALRHVAALGVGAGDIAERIVAVEGGVARLDAGDRAGGAAGGAEG
jgi:hypothetical protein